MIVETIANPAGFEKLRNEWSELLEASDSNCLFLTWEWLHTWWQHLSEGRRLFILTVRDGGQLVGIAPLALRARRLIRFLPFSALELLGTGSVGSDYLDVIVRRGVEERTVRTLAEYLAARKRMLDLSQFNKGSVAIAPALARRLRERGWKSREALFQICPFIDLSEHSWASYLATLDWEHRHNFKRRLRQITKQFAVGFDSVVSEAQRREALDALLNLHDMRWRERGGSNAFHTPGLRAFHEEMSRLALQRGWLRLFLLRLDGQPTGSLYGFLYDRRFYFYQQGFDPRYEKYSIGLLMTGLTIQRAIEERAKEYDFLRGDERFKFHWAVAARPLGRLELYPPGARGSLSHHAMRLRGAVRSASRRLLSHVSAYKIRAAKGTASNAGGRRHDPSLRHPVADRADERPGLRRA